MATLALVLGLLGAAAAAPVTYDQRQHGELNIRAQLDNIVILLIPSSKINLMGVSPNKPDQSALLELLQNHIQTNEVLPVESAQGEEEQEVEATVQEMTPEATVQEMTPESTEKTTTPAKHPATEKTFAKEHSTVSESMQDVVFKISIPVELKDAVKKAEERFKISEKETKEEKETKKEEKEVKKEEKDSKKEEKEVNKALEKEEKVSTEALKLTTTVKEKDQALKKKEQTQERKEESPLKKKEDSSAVKSPEGLDALIKPVAARSSTEAAVTGVRREKVIRYKPDAKWAPGLTQLLGPVRQERTRFGPLCAPGSWDSELRTCIMPGETRSRDELARFLEAMRFGIAIPAQ